MENIEFYHNIAKKYLSKHRYFYLLNNDDAITDIAHYMMLADHKYDNHTGSIEGYRSLYARYGLLHYWRTQKKNTNNINMDLCQIASRSDDTFDVKDFLSYAQKRLDHMRYKCLKLYFVGGLKYREIAIIIDRSLERVRQLIKESIPKIRGYFDEMV